ncbi:arsenate-mycothiol transferase ArsC [Frigoriglobus tundricola]|uniref:Protein tyrosine phosphatase n=1 Tax=Frigoriglobus tundricola TaxID=2774151 RepID=A0A6M5YZW1_9BACT|nr:low molecular weight phosphatase family protein [Frigoriglobus tundricola]QJW98950.1 Protein tyrosine phosphatase [Frigoriglobus tundricola]
MESAGSDKTVLFLCTGNYYRSRHAEIVFNHHATVAGLGWRAISRGLALELGVNNVGPMAQATRARLTGLGISHAAYLRLPAPVTDADLTRADLIVALKEAEHRPLLTERHPGWAERTHFWHVHDVDFAVPDVALPQIEDAVLELIRRLGQPE